MKYLLNILVLFSFFFLNNCTMTLQSLFDTFNYSKTGLDIISYSTTSKTSTDHALSFVFKKDCALARTIKLQNICKEAKKKNNVDLAKYHDKLYRSNLYKLERVMLLKNKKNKQVSLRKKIIKVPSMAYDR